MVDFDVIVAGAGPAGSLSAYHLAAAGLKVLILDKAKFPRRKICGGGLTEHAARYLPFDVSTVIQREVNWGYLGFRGKHVATIHSDQPIACLVERSSFDAFLLQQAREAGAVFHQDQRVIGFREEGEITVVQTSTGQWRARFLIGADGVHSQIARLSNLAQDKATSLSYEALLKLPPEPKLSLTDSITFDFGTLFWGYGWIFPKANHLNVGVFRNWPGRKVSRRQLLRFINQHSGLRDLEILDVRAYPGPLGGREIARHAGRTVLVGDAAQLADPWLGEGITFALLSARLAAEAILEQTPHQEPDLANYSLMINEQITPQLVAARKLSFLINLFYGVNVQFLRRSPTLQQIIIDLLRGERSRLQIWTELKSDFPRILFNILRKK